MQILVKEQYDNILKIRSELTIPKTGEHKYKWKDHDLLIKTSGYPNVVNTLISKNKSILMLLCKKGEIFVLKFVGGWIDPPGIGRSKHKSLMETPNDAILGEIREELNIRGLLTINEFDDCKKTIEYGEKINIITYYIKYDDITIFTYKGKYNVHEYLTETNETCDISFGERNFQILLNKKNNENIHAYIWLTIDDIDYLIKNKLIELNISENFNRVTEWI